MDFNSTGQDFLVPINSNLRLSPIDYPGTTAPWHCVVSSAQYQRIIYTPGRRLGQSRVLVLNDQDKSTTKTISLNKYLLSFNSARIDERFPVVGVGSNSDPQVMAEKFARFSQKHGIFVDPVFPMFKATLLNVRIGHLPVPSKGGYFALAAHAIECGNGLASEVTVSFLDRTQLRALDETEPNYQRALVEADSKSKIQLIINDPGETEDDEFHGKELLDYFYIYRSRWGILREKPSESPVIPYKSQEKLFAKLGGKFPSLFRQLEQIYDKNQSNWINPNLNEYPQLNEGISNVDGLELHVVKNDELSIPGSVVPEPTYADIPSRWAGIQTAKYRVLATKTGKHENRNAPLVTVSIPIWKELKIQSNFLKGRFTEEKAKVSFQAPTVGTINPKFDCIVQLNQSDESYEVLRLDQLVRNAIGVEINEFVDLEILHQSFSKIQRYQVLRRQTADTSVVEQDACIMDSTAMKMLGVEDGDQVLLIGQPCLDKHKKVPQVKLRVFAADDKIELRREKSGGGLSSRFPGTDSTLGVHPDIPWVFLDGDAAKKLNISHTKMQPVLARASYLSLWAREVRDISIALSLAFIGILFSSENRNIEGMIISAISVGLILISATFLVSWKIFTKVGINLKFLARKQQ